MSRSEAVGGPDPERTPTEDEESEEDYDREVAEFRERINPGSSTDTEAALDDASLRGSSPYSVVEPVVNSTVNNDASVDVDTTADAVGGVEAIASDVVDVANSSDAENSGEGDHSALVAENEIDVAHECYVSESGFETYGALDSCCNRTVAGIKWVDNFIKLAIGLGLGHLVLRINESEFFRFGNGGRLESQWRVRLPVVVYGKCMLIWFSTVENDKLGALIGKDLIKAMKLKIDFDEDRVDSELLGVKSQPLEETHV